MTGAIVLAAVALVCFIIGFFQFRGKGILLNNAYFYASDEEKKRLNKKPYYRQSGITFTLMGMIMAVNSLTFLLHVRWMLLVVMVIVMITVVYVMFSDFMIGKKH